MQNLIDLVDVVLSRVAESARQARLDNGNWYPACGGLEVPFKTRSGITVLYCWQPSTGKHAYINTQTDLVLTDEEARAALGTY